MDIEQARFNMIEQQIRPWNVLDDDVLDTLSEVPRERFVPEEYQQLAFSDLEIPIAHGQQMMSPKVEGRMLQALHIDAQDQVLEIGTGTGFATACLAKLGNFVTTIDIFPEFIDAARKTHAGLSLGNIFYHQADIFEHLDSLGKFDAIAITAALPQYLHRFEEKLNPGGRLFCVVGSPPVMNAQLTTCIAEGDYLQETLFETQLSPIINYTAPKEFEF